jgi:hypothetical protein
MTQAGGLDLPASLEDEVFQIGGCGFLLRLVGKAVLSMLASQTT